MLNEYSGEPRENELPIDLNEKLNRIELITVAESE
jgi:hypothetical protein